MKIEKPIFQIIPLLALKRQSFKIGRVPILLTFYVHGKMKINGRTQTLMACLFKFSGGISIKFE